MGFRLYDKQHNLELLDGEFVIGRGPDCQLSISDPTVSSRHAMLTITADAVTIEDLGSRHGVLINGRPLRDRRTLSDGDTIAIGTHEYVFRDMSEDFAPPTQTAPNQLRAVGGVAEKSSALGRFDEAERLLWPYLQDVRTALLDGREVRLGKLELASSLAAKLAVGMREPRWIDYIIDIYRMARRPLPSAIIHDVSKALGATKNVNVSNWRKYIKVLNEIAPSLTPPERMLIGRLEVLSRLILADGS